MDSTASSAVTPQGCGYRMVPMSRAPKDTRSAAEKARDTAGIVGSLKHEGYVPTAEAEAVHQRVARGDITTDEAIKIFRDRALNQDAELAARKRRPERA
jgi:Antitoxin VbhA